MSTINNLVSVIIPAFNSSHFLPECLESVLQQTHSNLEIIVVDDVSKDETLEIIEKYQRQYPNIKLIKNSINSGPGISRNKGIDQANGEYIAFLDSDDLWEPTKIEKQVRAFRTNSDMKVNYCFFKFLNGPQEPNINIEYNTLELLLQHGATTCMPSSMMIKTDFLKKFKGFPLNVRTSEDWDLWLRMSTQTNFHCLPEPLYVRRQHENQISNMSDRTFINDNLVLSQFLQAHEKVLTIDLVRKAKYFLLTKHGVYYRIANKRVKSCFVYSKALFISPSLEVVKALLLNLFYWKKVSMTNRNV